MIVIILVDEVVDDVVNNYYKYIYSNSWYSGIKYRSLYT